MQSKNKIPLLLFFLLATIYFLTAPGYILIVDSYYSLYTAKAIVGNGSLRINTTGAIYSSYGIGLPLLWIPYVIVGKAIGALTRLPKDILINFLISFYNVFFGAGACVFMYYIVKTFNASNKISIVMALLLGLTTMCWHYSVIDFSEVTQMFFLLVVICFVLRNTYKSLTVATIFYGFLILLKAIYVIYVPFFILYLFTKNKKRISSKSLTKIFLFLFCIVISTLAIFILNYYRWGHILNFGYSASDRFSIKFLLTQTIPLLFSLNKGVFVYSPVVLLGIFGYINFFRYYRKESILFLGIIMGNLLFHASYIYHGSLWCWGPRYLVPMIPLYLLPLYIFWEKKRVMVRILLIFFISISFLIQLGSVLQNQHEYHQIRYNKVAEKIKPEMPPDIIGMFITLKHKILEKNSIFNLSEFGIDSNIKIDTSEFESCQGLNLWYCHLARYYNKSIIKYIPIIFLPLIIYLFIILFKTSIVADKQRRI